MRETRRIPRLDSLPCIAIGMVWRPRRCAGRRLELFALFIAAAGPDRYSRNPLYAFLLHLLRAGLAVARVFCWSALGYQVEFRRSKEAVAVAGVA